MFADGPLVSRLGEAGIETHLIALPDSLTQTRKESLTARGLLRPGVLLQMLGQVKRLAKFIREGNFDLVHTNSLKSDVIGGLAARWAGVPVLWHAFGTGSIRIIFPAPAVLAFLVRGACAAGRLHRRQLSGDT